MASGDSFDERLLQWIDDHRIGVFTSVATRLMDFGETQWLVWAIALLGAFFIFYRRAWRAGLAIGSAFYAGAIVSGLLKDQIERGRPAFPEALVQLSGYAFPSSHAAFTMAMSVALLVVVSWPSRRMLLTVASSLGLALLLIGSAMVYLGAHWATDVIAGWALGAVIGAGFGLAFRPRNHLSGAGAAN